MAVVDTNFYTQQCFELEIALSETTDDEKRRSLIDEHIKKVTDQKTIVPDFKEGLEWINVKNPLGLHSTLKNKIVVLDFFTYCCINCLHILPDLHVLEELYSDTDGVVVVGVHSAKFDNEKTSANILSAVLRYDITHPVVNDAEAHLWHTLQIQCWPTLVILGPSGEMLYTLTGEGHREKLIEFVKTAVEFYSSKGEISKEEIGIQLHKEHSKSTSVLSFPGKVFVGEQHIMIADTGHHRILVTDLQGVVKECIGSGQPGLKDGSFSTAQFNSPQGVTGTNKILYVADTENHVIRQIDLATRSVSTIAGTGQQGQDKEGGKISVDQEISSPWDVELGSSIGSEDKDLLFIAMAGTHQIWTLFLENGKWLKGSEYKKGTCIRFAGSGAEENRNNSYPHKAAFAQPSGITLHTSSNALYVADSESSSVRMITLKDGAVKALVGAERDPMNLFAYGDVDGKGIDAKLQHPLAVAVFDNETGTVAVADSYNHKIKLIDPKSKMCTTLIGQGTPGNAVSADLLAVALNEPGGLCVDPAGTRLYIADTNNHSIKVYDKTMNTVAEFPVYLVPLKQDTVDCDAAPKQQKHLTRPNAENHPLPAIQVSPGQGVNVQLSLSLPEGCKLTEEAPTACQIWMEESQTKCLTVNGYRKVAFQDMSDQTCFKVQVLPSAEPCTCHFQVECMLYYCDDKGTCKMKGLVFTQSVEIKSTTEQIDQNIDQKIIHAIKDT